MTQDDATPPCSGARDGARRRSTVGERAHELHRGLGELLDAAGALCSDRAWSLEPAVLSETIQEVYALEARLAELRSALLTQAERCDLPTWDANVNLVAWLRDRVGLAPAEAKKHVALARGLETYPHVRDGLGQGTFPPASALVVVAAADTLPVDLVDQATRDRAVAHLVTEARAYDTRTLARLGAHLEEVLDPEGADRRLAEQLELAEARAARQSFLHLAHDDEHQVTDGSFRIPLQHGVTP